MRTSHPPLDFPVYGVAGGPDGPRWLDHVDGLLGHPADGVWLGHGSTPRDATRPWVHVGSFRRELDFQLGPAVEDRARSRAVLSVVDSTMPDPTGRDHGYAHRLLDAATVRADRPPGWQQAAWTVDGRPATASTMEWAGAWVAYTTTVTHVYVVALGFGVRPDGLALTTVLDGSAYHVDLAAPITFPATVDASRAAAGVRTDAEDDRWWPEHPDHDLGQQNG